MRCVQVSLLLAVCGCVGDIASPPPYPPSTPLPVDPALPTPVSCSAPMNLAPRVRLLSSREYAGAVESLTGVADGLSLASRGDSRHTLFSPTGQVHEALAFELNLKAETVAAAAAPALVAALPCAASPTAACVRTAITSLGARAFRRPLEPAEVTKLEALYALGAAEAKPAEAGLALVLEALLQSPSFLNLVQVGGTNGVLSPHETAATLAFLLTESLPDAALLAAASAGQLSTREQVRAQVDRLLATDLARDVVSSRLSRWLEADDVENVAKGSAAFTAPLKGAMTAELSGFLREAVFGGEGDLAGLFEAGRTTITAPLGEWYGVPASAFTGAAALSIALPPERRGVLTLPAFLTSHAQFDNSSTVFRGLFINRFLLCRDTGAPPPGAVGTNPSPGSMPKNQREKAELRIANAPCSGCHASFEPFGVLFEHYDELGRYRAEESGLPVDSSWTLKTLNELSGPTASVLELAPKLAKTAVVRACVARAFSAVATAKAASPGMCAPPEVVSAFEQSSGSLAELMSAVAVWAASAPRVSP